MTEKINWIYWEPAHQEYYLNLKLNKKIPVVFHNLKGYDSHLIFQEVRKYDFKINLIPNTKYNINIHELYYEARISMYFH